MLYSYQKIGLSKNFVALDILINFSVFYLIMGYDKGPSIYFVTKAMNFILATGIFTLPFSLYESGVLLGTVILTVTCGLGLISCTYILEALASKNYLEKMKLEERKSKEWWDESLIRICKTEMYVDREKEEPISVFSYLDREKEEDDKFFISKRYEILTMANSVLGTPLYLFVATSLVVYFYICITSNGIIAGNAVKDILGKTLTMQLPDYSYKCIVIAFFAVSIMIAQNNISHLNKLSMGIMCCRFLIIFLIGGCCMYSIMKFGSASYAEIPKINMNNIVIMIGNSIFFFICHHSIPGMVENFSPQKRLIKLIVFSYIVSLIIMLGFGYLALLAFAKRDLQCDIHTFPCAIQNVFSLNFISVPIIGEIINYYPIFNVITCAMQLISLRNNLLQIIGRYSIKLMSMLNFPKKTGSHAFIGKFFFNTIICLPSICIALTLSNIQKLMKYFSSIFGFVVMIVIPIVLVYSYRVELKKRGYKGGNLNRSLLQEAWGYLVIGGIGILAFAFIIYGFFFRNLKRCVTEIEA